MMEDHDGQCEDEGGPFEDSRTDVARTVVDGFEDGALFFGRGGEAASYASHLSAGGGAGGGWADEGMVFVFYFEAELFQV
mmetsp:Transcript_46192/g.97049  ORF Transcript_46192/g.97049 Transcript_46192/m.97049 type:complete len:80 (-) Transcript_46192:128-367(-)